MSFPTKVEFIKITKYILNRIISNYTNKIITHKFQLHHIILDALWETTLRMKININKFLIIQRFIQIYTTPNSYPLLESAIILKLTIALKFLYDNTIEQIYEKIPKTYFQSDTRLLNIENSA